MFPDIARAAPLRRLQQLLILARKARERLKTSPWRLNLRDRLTAFEYGLRQNGAPLPSGVAISTLACGATLTFCAEPFLQLAITALVSVCMHALIAVHARHA